MENFITGFPGHESSYRAALASVLGQEDTDYFFDRILHHFFTVEDARFLKSLSLNCLRLPFNYRHFEDDMNPRVLKESGFKHLDRVINICANEGIYAILDMHTVPGGQSPGWHADSTTSYAAFWVRISCQVCSVVSELPRQRLCRSRTTYQINGSFLGLQGSPRPHSLAVGATRGPLQR